VSCSYKIPQNDQSEKWSIHNSRQLAGPVNRNLYCFPANRIRPTPLEGSYHANKTISQCAIANYPVGPCSKRATPSHFEATSTRGPVKHNVLPIHCLTTTQGSILPVLAHPFIQHVTLQSPCVSPASVHTSILPTPMALCCTWSSPGFLSIVPIMVVIVSC